MTSFDPGMGNDTMGNSYSWNYSNAEKPDYMQELVGTVRSIQWVQGREFSTNGPGRPQFWPDGKPRMNIRIALSCPDGKYRTFTFSPASKAARKGEKYSIHMELFKIGGNSMDNLIGKTILLKTWGHSSEYGPGKPRPFTVELQQDGPYEGECEIPAILTQPEVFCDDAVSGGQFNAPMQAMPVQGYGMQPQTPMAQPAYPQQAYVQPAPQMTPQSPMAQPISPMQPQPQYQRQPVVAPPSAPAVPPSVYDEQVPF